MNRLFGTVFDAPAPASAQRRWMPAMDLTETTDQFVLTADLPGLGEEDVNIEVESTACSPSPASARPSTTTKEGYHRVERAYGSFSRSLTLPEGVDGEAVSASFDRGVLEVRIPKPEQRKPRKISIARQGGDRGVDLARGGGASWPPPCSPSAPKTRAPTPAPAR